MRRRTATFVAALVTLLPTSVGCGGSSDGPTASHAASPPMGEGRRSQPYWVPVTSLSGTGNTTTKTFSIDSGALQGRLSWRCQSAPFTVVSVDASGRESPRKLAYALSCPKEAEGFSAERGTQTLKVTAAGEWSVDVAQQIDTALIEPLSLRCPRRRSWRPPRCARSTGRPRAKPHLQARRRDPDTAAGRLLRRP